MSYDPEIQSSLDLYRQVGFTDYQIYDAGTNSIFSPDANKNVQQAVMIPNPSDLYNQVKDWATDVKMDFLSQQAEYNATQGISANTPSSMSSPISSMGLPSIFGGSNLEGFNLGGMSTQSILLYLSLFMRNPKISTAMKGSLLGGNIGAVLSYFFGNKANRIMAIGHILGINVSNLVSGFTGGVATKMGIGSLLASPAALILIPAALSMFRANFNIGGRRRRNYRRSYRPYRRTYRRSYRRRRY